MTPDTLIGLCASSALALAFWFYVRR